MGDALLWIRVGARLLRLFDLEADLALDLFNLIQNLRCHLLTARVATAESARGV